MMRKKKMMLKQINLKQISIEDHLNQKANISMQVNEAKKEWEVFYVSNYLYNMFLFLMMKGKRQKRMQNGFNELERFNR